MAELFVRGKPDLTSELQTTASTGVGSGALLSSFVIALKANLSFDLAPNRNRASCDLSGPSSSHKRAPRRCPSSHCRRRSSRESHMTASRRDAATSQAPAYENRHLVMSPARRKTQ